MSQELPPPEQECFFISEIGKEDSPERRRADGVLRSIVEPAASDVDLNVVRADQIATGGQVNLQIIEHICEARTAVADLTGGNLNVYYEAGIRHAARMPLAFLADDGETLPFDLLQQRTIFFANDLQGAASCRISLREQLKAALGGVVDSPVDAALNIGVLARGDETQRALAELVKKIDSLTSDVHSGLRRPYLLSAGAIADLLDAWSDLNERTQEYDDTSLDDAIERMKEPIRDLARTLHAGGPPFPRRRGPFARRDEPHSEGEPTGANPDGDGAATDEDCR